MPEAAYLGLKLGAQLPPWNFTRRRYKKGPPVLKTSCRQISTSYVLQAGSMSYRRYLRVSSVADKITFRRKSILLTMASKTFLGLATASTLVQFFPSLHWSSCWSSNTPGRHLPQGLYTSHCQYSEHRYTRGSLLHFLQVVAWRRRSHPHWGPS